MLPHIGMFAWWEYAQANPIDTRKCRIVIRLLFDCHKLKSCRFKHKECNDPVCDKCDQHAVEDPENIMFRCPADENDRQSMWTQLLDTCPKPLYEDIVKMAIKDRTTFFLGGMGNAFIVEWSHTYHVILEFIEKVHLEHVK